MRKLQDYLNAERTHSPSDEVFWDQFLLGHSIHSQTIRNKS